MRRIIFFVGLISFELSALDPIVIQKALNGLEPLHMVTLTRSQVNDRNEIKRDDSNCLPITASEAVTVFSIVNLLFNESFGRKEFERCIELAKKHDFSNLEQINLLLADPLIRDKILKEKLETISKGKNQGWLIKNYKEELFPLEIQTKEKENYFILLKKAPSSRIKTIK